ncbi:MAG: tetratricopeptide repeat protein [Candidatus Cloacimonetes bacterium]|nr:tetratricopeptide repeat protein [Candidatus Cloacimonadota bacterium]
MTPQQMGFEPSPELMAVYHDLQARNLISVRVRLDRIRSPNPTPSTYYRAMLLVSLEQPERARPLVESLGTYPENRVPYLHANANLQLSLGKRALQGKDVSRAFSIFQMASNSKAYPLLNEEITKIVLETIQNPRFRYNPMEQLHALDKCIQLVPDSPSVLRLAIQINQENNSISEALRLSKILARIEPLKENLVSLVDVAKESGLPHEIENALAFVNQKLLNQRVEFISSPTGTRHFVDPDQMLKNLIHEGKLEEARLYIEGRRSQSPDDLELLIEHVRLLNKLGEVRSALVLLQNNESRFYNQITFALERIATLALTSSAQALEEIDSLLDSGSLYGQERTKAEVLRAQLYLEYKDPDIARQILESLIRASSEPDDEMYFLLGASHLKQQYFKLAEESFFLAHKKAPDKPQYILALANVARLSGSNTRSSQWAKKLVLAHPQSLEAKKANAFLNSRETSESTTPSPQILALSPAFSPEKLPDLLRIHLWMADPKNSHENPLIMFAILENQRHWDTLILKLEEFLIDNPVYPELEEKLAELYQKYPGLPQKLRVPIQPYSQIVSIWNSSNQQDAAIDFFHFLNSLPEFPIQLKLAFVPALMDKRQLNLSEDILREALLLDIETLKNYSELAYIYFLRNDYSTALQIYAQILSLEPKNVGILFKSAEVHRAMGNSEKAKEIYEEILATSQDDSAIRDAKFYLRSLNPGQG